MPIYLFECHTCGNQIETLRSIDHRDVPEPCPCGGIADRILAQVVIGQPGYQMQAVLGNGAHVKGHFGKEAKRK